ncbi:hypothetical protein [Amycolatopsis sp. NPDC058986]|uniref:hypothetical protein n=1 Tax=unclassified Amycolatopsis TaxID=2618356 RepID=UPI00366E197E
MMFMLAADPDISSAESGRCARCDRDGAARFPRQAHVHPLRSTYRTRTVVVMADTGGDVLATKEVLGVALRTLLADPYTRLEFGRDGLEELSRNLWPVLCQTCGGQLGEDPPAVVVVEDLFEVTASLHHQGCQRQRWTAHPLDLAQRYTSTHFRFVVVPFGNPARDPFLPTVLINPSLELVSFAREGDSYRATTVAGLRPLGLLPPQNGRLPTPEASRRGTVSAWLLEDRVIVQYGNLQWPVPIPDAGTIRRAGQVVLGVSTAFDPYSMDNPEQIKRVLRAGDIALATVPLNTTEPAPDISQPTLLIESDLAFAHEADSADWRPASVPHRQPTYDAATGRCRIGTGQDGPAYWQLDIPGTEMTNGLITGPPRTGKTNALRIVVFEALHAAVFGVAIADPLGRNQWNAFDRVTAVPNMTDIAATTDFLRGLATKVRAVHRSEEPMPMPRGQRGVIVVLDDAQHVLCDPATAEAAETIATLGPKHGIGLVVATESTDLAGFADRTGLVRALTRFNRCAFGGYHPQLAELIAVSGGHISPGPAHPTS